MSRGGLEVALFYSKELHSKTFGPHLKIDYLILYKNLQRRDCSDSGKISALIEIQLNKIKEE